LRPESDYYRNILGIECAKQGLVDEAIKQFQEAVRLAPSEPAYRSNLDRALALKQSGTVSPEDAR
jgi:Flp pilus assembly protein TadD